MMSAPAKNAVSGAKNSRPIPTHGSGGFGAVGARVNRGKQHVSTIAMPPSAWDEGMALPEVEFAPAFAPLFSPARHKVFYGGRGGAKSWAFARALLLKAAETPLRVLCAREFQVSIADSVHRLLSDQIDALGLQHLFTVQQNSITSACGSLFIFKGIRKNIREIKSLEGIDICWVEEAESVSKESWDILIPTIRKQGSEIWVSFNPGTPDDDTWKRFVLNPQPGAVVVKVGWEDNPWFPATLREEMEYCRRTNPDAYAHTWGGEPLTISDAQIFKGRYVVEPFETPEDARFYHGTDWGFAKDPTTLVRCFVKDNWLHIDQEAYGIGVELDEIPELFDAVPTARKWPIKADNSRPETISHVRRKGFNITAAAKWGGSVEDGLAVLKGFEGIRVHPRCKHTADEMRLYSYKVDRVTGDVLPIIVDANNHIIDALRYALDGYIKGRGPLKINPGILHRTASALSRAARNLRRRRV